MVVMRDRYPQTQLEEALLLSGAFAGAMFGQLTFGYIGDVLGRNRAMLLTNLLCVVCALGSALFTAGRGLTLYGTIAVWRFMLGMGVGGVYPLSATSAAEQSATTDLHSRRTRVAWAFFWQVPGATLPFFVAFVMAQLFPDNLDLQWRTTLGLGAVPAAVVTLYSIGKADSAEFEKAKQQVSLLKALQRREYWKRLIGTGGAWCCYNIVHFGPHLIAPVIIANIFNTEGKVDTVGSVALQTTFANSLGVPGVLSCIALYSWYSTKQQQFWGFLFIAVSFVTLAWAYSWASDSVLFFLFCVMMFSINTGPSVTTFVLPTEVYPSEVRSTFNGVSAALGKFGATTMTALDYFIYHSFGMVAILLVFAFVGLLGAVLTFFFVDDGTPLNTQIPNTERAIARSSKQTEYL